MKKNLSRRSFLKTGGIALTAGAATLLTNTTTFAAPGPKDFGTVRFGVISDPHVDVNGKNGMKMSAISLDCLKHTVNALNTDSDLAFVMVCGDLLLDGEWENAKAVKKVLDGLNAPYYVVAGNHDFMPPDPTKRREGYSYMTIEDFVQYFRGHGYDKSGNRHYAGDIVPGLRIVGLDANLPLNKKKWGGIVTDEQLSWLDKELSSHQDAMHVIFIHHNLVRWSADELEGGPKEWFTVDNDAQVRALLEKHGNSKIVISGHRHIALNLKEINGVNYFVSPSVNTHPMRYTIYDITQNGLSWQTPAVPMPTAEHLQARENLLDATWWRASQFADRNSFNDMEVLSLYENNGMRMGQKILKG
jgi:predicted phosphodiesterase